MSSFLRLFNIINKKSFLRVFFNSIYLFFSFWIWLYKKWVIGGEIEQAQDLILIILFMTISVLIVSRNPIIVFNIQNSDIKYKRRVYILTFFLACYSGFATVGNRALFDGISLKGVIKVFIMSCWYFPFLFWLNELKVSFIAKLCRQRETEKQGKVDRTFGLEIFAFISIVWVVLYIGIWPGALPYDGNLEIEMAKGIQPLSNWQPYVHVFLVRFFLYIFGHISGFFIFQILLGAGVLASVLNYAFNVSGCKKQVIWLVTLLLTFCPGLFTTTMILLRDYLFSVGMAWLFFMILIYNKECQTKGYYFCLFIALLLASTMRSNGIIPCITCAISFSICAVVKKDNKLFVVVAAVVFMVFCINGPLEKVFDVQSQTRVSFFSQPAIDAFMSVKKYGGELPAEAEELMEEITLLEKDNWWVNYNEDRFDMSCDVSGVSNLRILKCYVKAFLAEPHLVFWNRLNKTSAMWEVFGHGEGVIKRYFFVSFINEGSGYHACEYPLVDTAMTPITKWLFSVTSCLGLDFLLYRTGIFVIFLVNGLIFSDGMLMKRKMLALLPLATNFLGLLYAMGYHENRYIYWIAFCWIAGIIYDVFIAQGNFEREE